MVKCYYTDFRTIAIISHCLGSQMGFKKNPKPDGYENYILGHVLLLQP